MADDAEALAAPEFGEFAGEIAALLDEARRQAARSVNGLLAVPPA